MQFFEEEKLGFSHVKGGQGQKVEHGQIEAVHRREWAP
jgi:hypothetical protein